MLWFGLMESSFWVRLAPKDIGLAVGAYVQEVGINHPTGICANPLFFLRA